MLSFSQYLSNALNRPINAIRLSLQVSTITRPLLVIPAVAISQTRFPQTHVKAWSSSAIRRGKQGVKQNAKRNIAQAITTSAAAANDPYDFTTLEKDIADGAQRLRDELTKIRVGGHVGVESVGALRVVLKDLGGRHEAVPTVDKHKGRGKHAVGEKKGGSDESIRLEELAQVLQRGRTLVLMVGEAEVSSLHLCRLVRAERYSQARRLRAVLISTRVLIFASLWQHIKPISNALLLSQFSLNPTASTHNPLELHIPIPPPTAESRKQTLDAAAKCGESAGQAIRHARGGQQKRLRAMQLARTALPDDVKKAGDKMEKVVEQANKQVKEIVEQAKRTLEKS